MTTSTETAIRFVRFLGRCKTCKAGVAKLGIRSKAGGTWATRIDKAGFTVKANTELVSTCGACGNRGVTLALVRGKVSETECSAKCTGATGKTCECSCGGANHGAAHG